MWAEIKIFFANPLWWITVGIATLSLSVLGTVAGHYLIRRLDKFLSKTSKWWANRSEKADKLWINTIELMKRDEYIRKNTEIIIITGCSVLILSYVIPLFLVILLDFYFRELETARTIIDWVLVIFLFIVAFVSWSIIRTVLKKTNLLMQVNRELSDESRVANGESSDEHWRPAPLITPVNIDDIE